MQFQAKSSDISTVKSDCAIALIYSNKKLTPGALSLDNAAQGAITSLIKAGDIKLKAGQIAWIPNLSSSPFKRLLVACVGDIKSTDSEKNMSTTIKVVAAALAQKPIKHASINVDGLTFADKEDGWLAKLIAKTLVTSSYRFTESKSKKEDAPALSKLTLATAEKNALAKLKKGIESGKSEGLGINLTRELGDLPANYCTPTYLANTAKKMATTYPALTTKVLEEKQMEKLGMGSLLSVTEGSTHPAKFIIMEYKGKVSKSPTVLVGKGITFDTGGISLKPGLGMDEMKYDMCGAGSVFGALKALAEMKAKVHVIGIVAACENMPAGNATKPGDVVTSMSGQTIEVLNTDAEGRLILCDALTYAERYKPKAVIDIATLTGACIVALGHHASGLYANDQDLADKLLKAGIDSQDRAWQMPLWEEYDKQLESKFADIANIGGRSAGSVTAACFLSRFTKNYKWAHLDVAGTAFSVNGIKGATGRPVSLLVNYVLNNA